ncbi:MAG: nucleotidyl transferase AbiEii/AbiGii toxin family protein [Planctomycetota bacterium]
MASNFVPRLDALPAAQQRLWPELIDVPRQFVLYGGTALALRLAHRTSIDFDFFATTEFDPDELLDNVPFLRDATVVQKGPSMLTAIVERGGTVQVSFFGVPKLRRIEEPGMVSDIGLQVASLLDLAGTKAAVVQKRAEAKDYIDIDAIINQGGLDLATGLSAAKLIYGPQFNPELTLKALCFFGDGNLSTVPADTQRRLAEAVKAVNLQRLPTIKRKDTTGSESEPSPENGQ